MPKLLEWDNMPPEGTKVRCVRSDFEDEHVVGKEYVVGFDKYRDYGVLDENGWATENGVNFEFKIIEEPTKPFTKHDLKDGDYLEFESGDTGYWLDGASTKRTSGVHSTTCDYYLRWTSLMMYNDDLTQVDGKDPIIKVVRDGEVMFQREGQYRELTLEEIASKFGLPADKIRIKE